MCANVVSSFVLLLLIIIFILLVIEERVLIPGTRYIGTV